MTKDVMIDALNADISEEFGSAIQYINHASLITGARFSSIQKELLIHAKEEMQHATTLADQVAFLGGRPTTTVGPVRTSDDSEEMLKQEWPENAMRWPAASSASMRPWKWVNSGWPGSCRTCW